MTDNYYIPAPGDVVRIQLSELAPGKQGYALVVSPQNYQARCGLCLVCPIVFKESVNALEVELPGWKEPAVVLADQVRSIDFTFRQAACVSSVAPEVLENVKRIIRLLVN